MSFSDTKHWPTLNLKDFREDVEFYYMDAASDIGVSDAILKTYRDELVEIDNELQRRGE
jgi:hypothetical protein